jgi:hypothetical protein
MKCKWLIVALLAVSLEPCAVAQMRGGGFGRSAGFMGHSGRGFGRSAVFFGDPYLYADYPSGSLASEMPSPPAFVMQPAAVPEPKRESLLIELQGDRYVRFSGDGQSDGAPAVSLGGSSPIPVAIVAHELPPAVLIFRDGHQEQVQDYVIASGTLYARGDYWQSGSWRRDIQLSVLDIPATLRANQDHGVKFMLPSGPNEVVTRP